jgi:hypothetical protein
MPRRTGTIAVHLATACLCAACGAKDPIVTAIGAPVGNWRVERQTDRITGAPIANAWLNTSTSSNTYADFAEPAQLEISCFRDREPMITFKFNFKVGTSPNAVLAYRFDDRPGREPAARFMWRENKVIIDDKGEAARFLDEMAAAQLLYVRIRSLNAGRTAAEFRLDGAAAAIDAALARCHVLPNGLQPLPAVTASAAAPPTRNP